MFTRKRKKVVSCVNFDFCTSSYNWPNTLKPDNNHIRNMFKRFQSNRAEKMFNAIAEVQPTTKGNDSRYIFKLFSKDLQWQRVNGGNAKRIDSYWQQCKWKYWVFKAGFGWYFFCVDISPSHNWNVNGGLSIIVGVWKFRWTLFAVI